MPTIETDQLRCPACGQNTGIEEERLQHSYLFQCTACGFHECGRYLADDEARIEEHRAQGWTITPSIGGTTWWATRILKPDSSD